MMVFKRKGRALKVLLKEKEMEEVESSKCSRAVPNTDVRMEEEVKNKQQEEGKILSALRRLWRENTMAVKGRRQ